MLYQKMIHKLGGLEIISFKKDEADSDNAYERLMNEKVNKLMERAFKADKM